MGKPENPKTWLIQTRADKTTSEALDEIIEITAVDNTSDIVGLAVQEYSKQFPPYNSQTTLLKKELLELITKYATEKICLLITIL